MIRILLVQAPTLHRDGLRTLLTQEPDMLIVDEVSTITDAMQTAQQQHPDVVLIDGTCLPVLTGESVTTMVNTLRKEHVSGLFVLVAVAHEASFFKLFECGIAGYETLSVVPETLLDQIRRIARGEYVLHSELFEKATTRGLIRDVPWLADSDDSEAPEEQTGAVMTLERPGPLTPRELQILGYIKEGYSNKQIADRLGISDQTVKNHMTAILNKLGVADRTAAVVKALREGILSLNETVEQPAPSRQLVLAH